MAIYSDLHMMNILNEVTETAAGSDGVAYRLFKLINKIISEDEMPFVLKEANADGTIRPVSSKDQSSAPLRMMMMTSELHSWNKAARRVILSAETASGCLERHTRTSSVWLCLDETAFFRRNEIAVPSFTVFYRIDSSLLQ